MMEKRTKRLVLQLFPLPEITILEMIFKIKLPLTRVDQFIIELSGEKIHF